MVAALFLLVGILQYGASFQLGAPLGLGAVIESSHQRAADQGNVALIKEVLK